MKDRVSRSEQGKTSGSKREDDDREGSDPGGTSNATSDRITALHRSVGNQAIQRLHENGELQASLAVSQPADPHEREAERVAEAVSSADDPAPAVEETTSVQRKGSGGPTAEGGTEDLLRSATSGGKPMSEGTRSFFESRFGRNFGDVSVHTGSEADRAARSINAEAFTMGTDIAFARGQYDPTSSGGRELMAHELTHVVQQGGAEPTSGTTNADDGAGTSDADGRARRATRDEALVRSVETPDVAGKRVDRQPMSAGGGGGGYTPAPPTYTIQRGDTLSGIARALGVDGGWQALYRYNSTTIDNPHLIFPGQEIYVPPGAEYGEGQSGGGTASSGGRRGDESGSGAAGGTDGGTTRGGMSTASGPVGGMSVRGGRSAGSGSGDQPDAVQQEAEQAAQNLGEVESLQGITGPVGNVLETAAPSPGDKATFEAKFKLKFPIASAPPGTYASADLSLKAEVSRAGTAGDDQTHDLKSTFELAGGGGVGGDYGWLEWETALKLTGRLQAQGDTGSEVAQLWLLGVRESLESGVNEATVNVFLAEDEATKVKSQMDSDDFVGASVGVRGSAKASGAAGEGEAKGGARTGMRLQGTGEGKTGTKTTTYDEVYAEAKIKPDLDLPAMGGSGGSGLAITVKYAYKNFQDKPANHTIELSGSFNVKEQVLGSETQYWLDSGRAVANSVTDAFNNTFASKAGNLQKPLQVQGAKVTGKHAVVGQQMDVTEGDTVKLGVKGSYTWGGGDSDDALGFELYSIDEFSRKFGTPGPSGAEGEVKLAQKERFFGASFTLEGGTVSQKKGDSGGDWWPLR